VDEGKQDYLVCAEHVRELGGHLRERRVAAGRLVGTTVHGICNMGRLWEWEEGDLTGGNEGKGIKAGG
jgi:hypothetical protein